MTFRRGTIMSGWRRITGRPALAWGGACAAVLAAAGGAVSVTGAGAVLGGAASAGSLRQAARQAPAALPVVAIGAFTGRRPAEIGISADGGNIVTGIRWRSWTSAGATGRGRSALEDCVPDCAQGGVRYVPTAITLSAPVNGRFTVLEETRAGKVTTMRWPAAWPLDAA